MNKYIYLVPSINIESNIFMYCNYARMKPKEERCLNCKNNCRHKGKHTILVKEDIK